MSVADDLKEREQAAGNAETGNIGQSDYDEKFNKIAKNTEDEDFDDIIENNYGDGTADEKVDTHGDKVKRNYNADEPDDSREDVKDQEENPDSLYNSSPDASKSAGRSSLLGKRMKKLSPMSGVIGLILFAVVGVTGGTEALGASLLVNVKELFHSDRADASRTNRLNSRAFLANKFNNKDGCAKKTAICDKMSSISQKEASDYEDKKFKIRGSVIDADGKHVGDYDGDSSKLDPTHRIQTDEIEFPDGTITKSGKDFYAHADNNPDALRATERASPSKAKFYLNKFFDSVLQKFGFSKGAKDFPAPDEKTKDPNDPNNQKSDETDQDKVFNSEAGTVHGDPNGGTSDGIKNRTGDVEKDVTVDGDVEKEKSNTKGGAAGALMRGVCSLYRLGNLTEVAVKAYHATQLIRFGLMFLQAADQIKDGKGDGDRVTYLSNNLTTYDNAKTLVKDTDYGDGNVLKAGSPNPKYNLSATDSEGYKIATYGDKSGLKAFSQKFILGGGIGKQASAFTGKFEKAASVLPGVTGDTDKEKMKNFCRLLASPTATIFGSCAALFGAGTALAPETIGISEGIAIGGCACTAYDATPISAAVAKLPPILRGVVPIVGQCEQLKTIAQGAMKLAIDAAKSGWVQDLITKALTNLNIDDNTKGVDAGNAIASGAGLLLSTTATGYGLKPATTDGNNKEVSDYIAYTDPLENEYIALEKEDARQNPLDSENKYSLVGALVRSLKPVDFDTANKGLFGLITTIPGIYSTSIEKLTGTETADALYSQPSTLGDKNTQTKRLSHCDDSELQSIKAAGDTYCSIVGVSTVDELKSASDQAYTPGNQNINKLIDYMTASQAAEEKDGGTFCKFDPATDDFNSSSCGEDSKLPSIGDDGTPTPKSQYEKYLAYCTDERKASWGGQYEADYDGSQRDQDWYSGLQCTKTSTMMTNFRMWTNYCLQSGTSDGTSNCYKNDTTQSLGNVSNSECSSNGDTKAIYTCALKYDNYRYKWGGGHGDVPNATQWIADFKTGKIPEWTQILDCSGLVRMAFVEAMGIEDQAYTAPGGYDSSKYWQKVPLEQAQQGDIVTSSGHVAIVEANDPGAKEFKIFDAETENGAKESNIRHSNQSYSGTIAAYRAKKG